MPVTVTTASVPMPTLEPVSQPWADNDPAEMEGESVPDSMPSPVASMPQSYSMAMPVLPIRRSELFLKSDLLLRASTDIGDAIVMVMAAMMIKPQAPRRFLLAERSSPTKVEPQNISGSVMRKAEKPVQQVMWNCLNHLISLGRRQPGLEKEISWRSLPAARLLLREVRGLEWAVRPLSIPAWCSIVEKKHRHARIRHRWSASHH